MLSTQTSVLVVDDDVRILRMMQRILDLEGYRVFKAGDGEAAIDVLIEQNPDLVLLDIMMPDKDGYAVCRLIREFSKVPIIMVTARSEEEEKVKGLDVGADDYLTKPFSSRELVARVKAVLRRSDQGTAFAEPVFVSGNLTIDLSGHRVFIDERELQLTGIEYMLLACLVRNVGRVLTPDQILKEVWGDEYLGEHHLLRVNIARLRQKLADNFRSPRFIATRTGIGYLFLKARS